MQLDALQRAQRAAWASPGSVLMVWAAMGVFGAVTSAVNHAWGVEKQPSYFKHKLISFVMLVVAGLLLMLGLLAVSAINVVEARWFAGVIEATPRLLVLQGFAVRWATTSSSSSSSGWCSTSCRTPRCGSATSGSAPSSPDCCGAARWRCFSNYVRDLSRFSVHGSIAAVVVFLLWVYVSAVILLYGVEVTAAYARLRRHRAESAPAAPTPRESHRQSRRRSAPMRAADVESPPRTWRTWQGREVIDDPPCAIWREDVVRRLPRLGKPGRPSGAFQRPDSLDRSNPRATQIGRKLAKIERSS